MNSTSQKDQKYQSMLNKIDLNLNKKSNLKPSFDHENSEIVGNSTSKLNIMDLLMNSEANESTKNASLLKNQLNQLNVKAVLNQFSQSELLSY